MRAQAISLDFLFAFVIILTIIGSMGVLILQYTTLEEQIEENRDAELKAQSAINSLTQTAGNPSNWEDIV